MLRLAATAAAAFVTLAAPAATNAVAKSQTVNSVVTTLPFERYAADTLVVLKSHSLRYVNLDTEWHDVVARDATRPNRSAPWCKYYPVDPDHPNVQTCPLFWTALKPPGGSDPQSVVARKSDAIVQGLQDAKVGSTYTFYCSIHPWMVGTIQVAG
jgi:plastocyanin